ncbi:MAG: complex I NDUFA9 subunit family protein [Gammaproteobacteria bacterium]|nr:complex I NDUFA9 subunit family protein [Gammaproteobacteria bacterium]MDH5661060.1 complex I NDUFA9 subunit family protein [Gammaproteobacteria bacterium]
MNILITGATGFVGSHITDALLKKGHEVTVCVRNELAAVKRWAGVKTVPVDYVTDNQVSNWLNRLESIDVVINAVGIIRETGNQTFTGLHTATPIALFKACEEKGVKRVIQVSALGADENCFVSYQKSKKAADDTLRNMTLDWFVLRPSLIYGEDGTSTRFFNFLASFPLLPIIDGGKQLIQPVHIDDLVDVVLACLTSPNTQQTIDVVGPESFTLAEWLQRLRTKKGKGKLYIIPIPYMLMKRMVHVLKYIIPLFTPDNLKMLQQGNVASSEGMNKLLGRKPRELP